MANTLLLDLDGTLVDSIPDLVASCNRMMVPRGHAAFTRAEVTPMVGDGASALVRRVMAARGQVATQADVQDFIADYTAHAADETVAYPAVVETLAQLTRAGWRLAVCTNKPVAPARALLARLDLLDRFAVVAGGDSFPVRKPDPAHLLLTLEAAGGTPAQAVMVGDHHNDVAAARAAGLPCIFAAWGYGTAAMAADAQATAQGFADIPALANSLLTPPG